MLKPAKKAVKHVLRALRSRWVTHGSLVKALREIGVSEGGLLLVHSSLSKLGYVPGGAITVIGALREVLGKEGTLVMPAHTWEWMNKGLRVFDARSTPGCVGALPEVFRKLPGTLRSLHPTHSVCAAGPLAQWLCEGHETSDTPCGEGTPYAKLLEKDGQILFLGATLESNTSFHTMEAVCDFPHLLRPGAESFELIALDGKTQKRAITQHLEGIGRRYDDMEEPLAKAGVARRGSAGEAKMLLLPGISFAQTVAKWLHEDPLHLMADRHQPIPSPRA